jgi:uncharacterized delta-60 repeat protein
MKTSTVDDGSSFRLFIVTAVLFAAALNLPAQSPTADSLNPGTCCFGVFSLAMQTDGKILVGGDFSTLGGLARNSLGRLNSEGVTETAFNPGLMEGDNVNALALQADGKILVGGIFWRLGGQTRNFLGRLNTNGSLDTAFNPGINASVSCLAVQPDGKILVGGYFSSLGGQPRSGLGRLTSSGALDTAFNPSLTNSFSGGGGVSALVVQPDGKILVGGNFTSLGGQARTNLGRLNADGNLDTTFNCSAGRIPKSSADYVTCLALQADGKIIVGGHFDALNGQARTNLGRLNPDGSVDAGFNPAANNPVLNADVRSVVVQPDGKIIVAGFFTTLGGQARTNIGRLNANGNLDTTFDPGVEAGGYVEALALQPDWKILVGGVFTTLAGQSRTNIGRLNNTGSAEPNLTFDGSTITWLRGGTSPEVWRTTFEVCTNGSTWISLGAGQRITGGWQLTGLNYPANAAIRARGFVCGASWFVETLFAPTMPLRFVNANANPPVSNGWFNVRLTGTTGSNAVVECSSDLVVWTPWKTNTLSASGWELAAPLGTNRQQFFRAKLAP